LRIGEIQVAKKLDPKGTISFEELLTSNIYTQEALMPGMFLSLETCWTPIVRKT